MASLAASHDTILVLASDGTLAADLRPLGAAQRLGDHRARRPAASRVTRAAEDDSPYTEFLAAGRWRELCARPCALRR